MAPPIAIRYRGPAHDDKASNLDIDTDDEMDIEGPVEVKVVPTSIEIALPFEKRDCTQCQEKGLGLYILLDLNNAERHYRTHNAGVKTHFKCTICDKTFQSQHAEICHMPKCPGPKNVIEGGTLMCHL
jgi:hypothetical protein